MSLRNVSKTTSALVPSPYGRGLGEGKLDPEVILDPTLSVVKVGGSLFAWPEFKTRLQHWLDSVPQSRVVIFPGGGKYVDKVRRWQTQYGWTDERSHDRALDMLMVTSCLMKNWLPNAAWTNDPAQIKACPRRVVVVDCSRWARKLVNLPQDWNLTSDSLSAILASQLEATELVLLKSRLPATSFPGLDPDLVDPLFGYHATTPVRIVNLRCPSFSECSYPIDPICWPRTRQVMLTSGACAIRRRSS